MPINRWSQIEEIFQGAIERPASERSEYLAAACGEDAELRFEVESLLANDADDAATLRSLVDRDLREVAAQSEASEAGLQAGAYRLLRQLDSGGMGAVYLAVRSDDQYFQIVAIKMIRKGLESPELLRRFRAERQILATLSHPNIGAILDGGDTEDGRPFIVMEYVEGQPITVASESYALSLRQRIELFQSVCSAVHYAHQKLVIHRDIKPSNVLVTPEGIVKLIDFGVSKPLRPSLLLGELAETQTGQRLMTPDYASPEQILGLPLTAASDIYSLGVLLYELLTGSRPYTLSGLSPAAAERIVCHQEISKPSSRQGLSEQNRRQLRGDLDRIVSMAMEKDPSRRYASAREFEEDLSRYLQGRPVAARSPTPAYRLRKFVARHRTATLMVCAIAAVVVGSVLLHSRQSRKANREVRQIQTLANSAIADLTEKLEQSPGSTDTQAVLFQSALKYLEQLRQSSGNDPNLLLQLSKAYLRVGDLEGSPFVANLGNSETTISSYQEALRTAIQAQLRMPGDKSTVAVIEAYQRLAGMQSFLGNISEAYPNYEKSLSLARDFWQQKPDDQSRRQMLAMNYAGMGNVELANLAPDKALENFRQAFQIFGHEPNGDRDHDRTLTRLHLRIAAALNELGSQPETIENVAKAIAITEALAKRFPSDPQIKRDLFAAYQNSILSLSGRDMMNVGNSSQAQINARKALAIAEGLASSDVKNAQARYDLALAYAGMGDSFRLVRPVIAGRWYRKSISLTKEMAPRYGREARHWIAERDEGLAEVLVKRSQAQERLQLLEEANQIRQELAKTSPHGRLHLMSSYCKLSDAELGVGNAIEAQQFSEKALPLVEEFKANSPSLLVLRSLGLCYESIGNVQSQLGLTRTSADLASQATAGDARQWYSKSVGVWNEFRRRGAANPESEIERHKVEHLLRASRTADQLRAQIQKQ